jgi:hypothetical protein
MIRRMITSNASRPLPMNIDLSPSRPIADNPDGNRHNNEHKENQEQQSLAAV